MRAGRVAVPCALPLQVVCGGRGQALFFLLLCSGLIKAKNYTLHPAASASSNTWNDHDRGGNVIVPLPPPPPLPLPLPLPLPAIAMGIESGRCTGESGGNVPSILSRSVAASSPFRTGVVLERLPAGAVNTHALRVAGRRDPVWSCLDTVKHQNGRVRSFSCLCERMITGPQLRSRPSRRSGDHAHKVE